MMGGLFRRKQPRHEEPPKHLRPMVEDIPFDEEPPADRLLAYRVANLQGVGARERQEDSFGFANAMDVTEIRRKGLLAVVADGMGGMEDGKRVSETAVAGLMSGFAEMDREGDLAEQLESIILQTNGAVYDYFQGVGGTTLVACVLFQESLYWASVGDSFLYLKRGGGLYRLNRDQNYRGKLYLEAVRAGDLDPAPIRGDPDGHRLSQFLGMDEIDDVDRCRRPLPLRDGDVVLLCSDGVGGVLDDGEILQCLQADSPARACAMLEDRIRAAGRRNQDNYTALIVECAY